VILALLLTAVISAPPKLDVASDARQLACYQRASNQQGRNSCVRDAYNRAEKRMREEWALLFGIIKAEDAKHLNTSQEAWLAYRAAWCRAVAWDQRGQADWAQWHFGCLAALTRQRTKEIDDLIVGDGY